MLPPLAVSFCLPIRQDTFRDLEAALATGSVPVEIEERDPPGPQAGLEWLLPTMAIVFIGKSYFDGFFKEAGKDHYTLLKKGLSTLYGRLVGPGAPALTVVSTAGKRSDNDYSLLFSLMAEADDGLRFKLLIQKSASEEEYAATVSAFLEFLDAFHAKTLGPAQLDELRSVRHVGRTVLLAYSADLKRVTVVDPLPPKVHQ